MTHASGMSAWPSREDRTGTRATRDTTLRGAATTVYFVPRPALWPVARLVILPPAGFHKRAAYALGAAFPPAPPAVLPGTSPLPTPPDPAVAHQAAYFSPPFV